MRFVPFLLLLMLALAATAAERRDPTPAGAPQADTENPRADAGQRDFAQTILVSRLRELAIRWHQAKSQWDV